MTSRSSSSKRLAALLLAAWLGAAWAQAPVPGRRLCADDPRKSADTPVRNDEKRTVGELLGIAPRPIAVEYTTGNDVEKRLGEILAARPRSLSPFINWSEGADMNRHSFIAKVDTARVEASGYLVCIRDARGNYWYFRNVPGDLWER